MPSFFCGIFGHKPSSGAVNNKGQLPVAGEIIDTFLTTGKLKYILNNRIHNYIIN